MAELEQIVMPRGEDDRRASGADSSRRSAPSGSTTPTRAEIDYVAIFPDLFRRLRDHYFEERKRQLRRSREDVLRYLSDDRGALDDKARRRVEDTLRNLRDRYGYCEGARRTRSCSCSAGGTTTSCGGIVPPTRPRPSPTPPGTGAGSFTRSRRGQMARSAPSIPAEVVMGGSAHRGRSGREGGRPPGAPGRREWRRRRTRSQQY